MSVAIIPSPFEAYQPVGADALIGLFLAGRSPQTLRAYRQDLDDFAHYLASPDLDIIAARLLAAGPGPANAIVLSYRTNLVDRRLAAATVNRRLAALRSLVKLARTLGLVTWALEVPGLSAEPYRDTRGPGLAGVRQLLRRVARRQDAKGRRDHAILRLLFDLGLRRSETVALDRADLDLEAGTLAVLGKGRTGKVRLTLPEPTRAALGAWLETRGEAPGPLFPSLDRTMRGGRLSSTSVYRMVRALGAAVGLTVRPHGLRHTAITAALDLTGDLRAVQRFSRHRDVRVLTRYDDNRADLGGVVARRVAATV
jgi:integrase/recombinase XerC